VYAISASVGKLLPAEKRATSSQDRFWSWLLTLIVVLAAYGMLRSVALRGLDLHHDTFMFDTARRTLNGEVPYWGSLYLWCVTT
jgi:hypothetical protein